MATQSTTPIKTDLFRFVSLRTPQLIDQDRKKLRFIVHPDLDKSFFTRNIDGESISGARDAVQSAAKSFNVVFKTLQDIKDKFKDFYDFSSWLTRNRNTVSDLSVTDQISTVAKPGLEDILSVWDHLFYQLIKRNSPTVRQACIQLIIAEHFFKLYKETDYKKAAIEMYLTPRRPASPPEQERIDIFLRKTAQSRVLVPKCFSVEMETVDGKGTSRNRAADNELTKKHKKLKSAYRADKYNSIRSELQAVSALVETGGSKLGSAIGNSSKTKANLSAATRSFLDTTIEKETSFNMAVNYLDELIKTEKKNITKLSAVTKTGKTRLPLYSYAMSMDDEGLLLTMNVGYNNAYIAAAEQELKIGNNTMKSQSVTELANDGNNLLLVRLVADTDIPEGQSVFQFKGSFTLDDGNTIEVDTSGSKNNPATTGVAMMTSSMFTPPTPPAMGILYGVHRLGIGVYRKVEQEVCCYVPGEVSRIENIMAREYKERQTRSLISTETTEEETTEIEVETQSDTVSTNRNEMQSEIARQLSKDTSIGVGASVGVSGSYAGVTVSADGSFDFASSSSTASSDSQAQTYAQEVTNNALERVLQKTTQKRTSKILEEYEENNRHGYDNREGTEHVTGVYRWIDIIYKNRLVNYGKRLMMEFLIPEPAKFYKQALKAQAEDATTTSVETELEAPVALTEHGINSAADISEENYLELGRAYDVTLDDPITPEETTITKSLTPRSDPSGQPDPDADPCSYTFSVNFNDTGEDLTMYSANKVDVSYSFSYHLGSWPVETGTYFKVKVYDEMDSYNKDNLSTTSANNEANSKNKSGTMSITLPDVKTGFSASVQCKNVYDFTINLTIKLKWDEDEKTSWQNSVYDALMQAYDDQLAEYESAVSEQEEAADAEEEEKAATTSSDFNRSTEQRELQRIAIEMLLKPFGRKQGKDFYYTGTCDVPQVKQNYAWEEYSSQVKFFEQAFDWTLMAYIFYPYYWAGKCSWTELLQTEENTDSIFQGFLQSGMARMVVPVRPGFEEAVDFYMATGETWNGGGLVMDTDDDLYVSIDEELMEIEGFVDQEWETRVPTTLTIIQGNSVYLEDEGLPCCHELEDGDEDTLLRGSDTILGEASVENVTEP